MQQIQQDYDQRMNALEKHLEQVEAAAGASNRPAPTVSGTATNEMPRPQQNADAFVTEQFQENTDSIDWALSQETNGLLQGQLEKVLNNFVDIGGYFRAGYGRDDKGGPQPAFQAPGVSNIANIAAAGTFMLNFTYDYMGRRIQKIVYTNSGSAWIASYTNKFIYEGRNLVAILDGGNNLLSSFLWGSDLSGSMQGAGGVGGLVSMTVYDGANAGTYFYCYDGNGNVTALVNAANGSVVAQYEYGPFGEVIRATGPMAKVNPFRFSTDYYDDETDIIMYPRRPYSPSAGRFLTRDPIGENGGVNLYDLVANNPVNENDPLGLCNIKIRCGPVKRLGITLGWHCGVVAPNGVEYGIGNVTGGSSQGSSGGGTAHPYPDPVNDPNPTPGTRQPDQVDYPVSCGKCASCDSIQKCIQNYNSTTPVPPYNALSGPNSDTWAHNMLNTCGCSVDPIPQPCYTIQRSPKQGGPITICPGSTTTPPGTVAW
jgi:RHS repeat-associated protein